MNWILIVWLVIPATHQELRTTPYSASHSLSECLAKAMILSTDKDDSVIKAIVRMECEQSKPEGTQK